MKRSVVFLACALGAASAFAAARGSSESSAVKISPSSPVTVTLVDGYDSFFGYTGEGAYWLKLTAKRGNSYSVWLSNPSDPGVTIESVSTSFESMEIVSAMFMSEKIGSQTLWILYDYLWFMLPGYEEYWDPPSATFYIHVSGVTGDKVTVHFEEGVALPYGLQENPMPISITTDRQEKSGELNEDMEWSYYYRATLEAGRMYQFATTGGSKEYPVTLDRFERGRTADFPDWASQGNTSYTYVPEESGAFDFCVSGAKADAAKAISLLYRVMPQRPIGKHESTVLSVGETADCEPGHINARGSEFYDDIIDECLFSFSAEAGRRYGVRVANAKTNVSVRVYDAAGKILLERDGNALGGYDTQLAFTADKKATYYFGVCQKLEDDDADPLLKQTVRVSLLSADAGAELADPWDPADDVAAGASFLKPVVTTEVGAENPVAADPKGHGEHRLGLSDWTDVLAIAGRKYVKYAIQVSLPNGEKPVYKLGYEVFTISGKKEKEVVTSGDLDYASSVPLSFMASENATHYLRLTVKDRQGADYPAYKVHCAAYMWDGSDLASLTVAPKGCETATWYLDNEKSTVYPQGATIQVAPGAHKVTYVAVKGFSAPAARTVTLADGQDLTLDGDYYSDTADHKDDTTGGATSWSLKNVETSFDRTLWSDDPADNFAIAGKDGYLFDFAIVNADDDVVFSISGTDVKDVTSVKQLALPTAKAKYYLTVKRGPKATEGGKYTIVGKFANVGAIKFAKAAVSAKDTATSVKLTVNRTAKDGQVKVAYTTVDGTARAGENYVAQAGDLVWENGDNKAKTIEVKLIPKLGAWYAGGNKQFSVVLTDAHGEYPALISGDEATVTLTETSKEGVTAASVYAKKAAKGATTKTEDVPLESGTFYGVVRAADGQLTNGLPTFASVTLTATAATDKKSATFSAKVALAGKTYAFKDSNGWDETGATCKKELVLEQTFDKVKYESVLTLELAAGRTTDGGWKTQSCHAALRMNVPDAKGKGAQFDIRYAGALYRQNAKIQDYLTAVTNFTGYYTVALLPAEAVRGTAGKGPAGEGAPSGYGYLTVKIDNKGKATVAGLLADSTKVSASVTASAVVEDPSSANGLAMVLPIYQAKSPYCLGGALRLVAEADVNRPDGKSVKTVVSNTGSNLVWANDDAALAYDATTGLFMAIRPVGGWYDTVFNLQSYYRDYALEVATADITEFPKELIPSGYDTFVPVVQPNAFPVDLAGDALATAKKSLVKDKEKLYDWSASVNPANVQVKLARATGIVTGSFSLWCEGQSKGKTVQKEVSGFKHYGILTLDRAAGNPLDAIDGAGVFTTGFLLQKVKVPTGVGTKTRNWNCSLPFLLVSPVAD